MALPVDSSTALRTQSELTQLAEAVLQASPAEPETDSIEWKSDWNLRDAATRFETARHLLGFANRRPSIAQRAFEGCAYLLAGVEPGRVAGISTVDPAELDDQLGRYIEPGHPRWTPHFVSIDQKPILVLCVESPREGDPICVLQKGFNQVSSGRIFIRRHGKTEEAGPADIRALEARTRPQKNKVSLEVVPTAPEQLLRRLRLSEGDCTSWLENERRRLTPPPREEHSVFEIRGPAFIEDIRGRAGFEQEVARYLNVAETRWLGHLLIKGIDEELALLNLQIENPTERNFEGVEVSLDIQKGPYVWLDEVEVFDFVGAPDPPDPWGKKVALKIPQPTALAAAALTGDEVKRAETSQVKFVARHVRPGETLQLPPVHLTLPASLPDDELSVHWRLTSTGADGWREGDIYFSIEEEAVELAAPRLG